MIASMWLGNLMLVIIISADGRRLGMVCLRVPYRLLFSGDHHLLCDRRVLAQTTRRSTP